MLCALGQSGCWGAPEVLGMLLEQAEGAELSLACLRLVPREADALLALDRAANLGAHAIPRCPRAAGRLAGGCSLNSARG